MAELSDDMSSWPNDPYALLGVVPGTEARAIRQAYTALIRRFKPEKFPEQFRRIREAFDQVQAQETWRKSTPPIGDPPTDIPVDIPGSPSHPSDTVAATPLPPWSLPTPASELDDDALWDEACGGGHERVYRQLREASRRDGAAELIFLRLYWLRVAFPEIDWDVKPIDWLVKALAAGHELGRVPELLQIELLYRPELCRDAGLIRALDRVRNLEVASRIYGARWQAAIRHDQWNLVVDEIPIARGRLFDAPQAAVALFSWLVGALAWSDEDHIQRAYRDSKRELDALAAGSREFDYIMERIDFLGELVEQWRTLPRSGGFFKAIRELLPVSWSGTAGEIRWRVFALFQQITADISQSLARLDRLHQSVPLVLAQTVASAQQTYFPSRGTYRVTPDRIKEIYRRWPDRDLRGSLTRLEIAEFLARQQLSIDEFAAHLPYQEMNEHARGTAVLLANDDSLRLINLAQLALSG
jgi:hypothetical protein